MMVEVMVMWCDGEVMWWWCDGDVMVEVMVM